jgi:hypothetical protein
MVRKRTVIAAALAGSVGAVALLAGASHATVTGATVHNLAAQQHQVEHCIKSWNRMHTTAFYPSLAAVKFRSRCSVVVAYSFPADGSQCGPRASRLPGNHAYCVDRAWGFNCSQKQHGSYRCPTHADDRERHVRWNARLHRAGRITLDKAPTH